jgi:uncharacterized protein YfiM (DUF2279 family)
MMMDLVSAQFIRQDHLLHASGSACLSGLTYCAVFKATNNITLSTVSSIGLSLSVGVLKEVHDMRTYGSTWKQSGGDMAFNVLGAFASTYTIRYTFRNYQKKPKFVKLKLDN